MLYIFIYKTLTFHYDISTITTTINLYSNALRNDLQHPNEYIRGATLRFLCKIREAEVLEPLIASVRACLVSNKKKDNKTKLLDEEYIIYIIVFL